MAAKKVSVSKGEVTAQEGAGSTPEAPGAPKKEPARDNLPLLADLPLVFSVEIGRTRATLETAAGLGEQSVVELDKGVGDPVDILLNGRLFARGEVVTVAESFGVRITEILSQV